MAIKEFKAHSKYKHNNAQDLYMRVGRIIATTPTYFKMKVFYPRIKTGDLQYIGGHNNFWEKVKISKADLGSWSLVEETK